MSFYHLPHPWNPGYAIPEYVMAEPPERGTFTTKWLPRGTIPALVPDYLAKPGRKLLGRRNAGLGSLDGHCLEGNTLDGHTLRGHSLDGDVLIGGGREYKLESLGDAPATRPLELYGANVSSFILARIRRVPEAKRKVALKLLLDRIDPSLWASVDARATALGREGVEPHAALQRALAECMARGVVREVAHVGARAMRGDKTPSARGQLGLAAYDALDALGLSWGDVKDFGSDVLDFAQDAGKYIGKATCAVVNNQAGQMAIAGGATLLGAPPQYTAMGVKVAQGACSYAASKGTKAAPPRATIAPPPAPAPAPMVKATLVAPPAGKAAAPPPPAAKPAGGGGWLLPAGAAVAAFFALRGA